GALGVSPEPDRNAWNAPGCSEVVQAAAGGRVPVHLVSARKDSPRAVRASGYFLWYTATRARSARLNFKNVAGVSNPVKPVPRGKGNAVPPAVRLVFASSRSVSMNVKIWSVLVTMGA